MLARTPYFGRTVASYDFGPDEFVQDELILGERICEPGPRSSRRPDPTLRLYVFLLVALCSGLAVMARPQVWGGLFAKVSDATTAALALAKSNDAPAPAPIVPAPQASDPSAPAASAPIVPLTTASIAPEAPVVEAPPAAPLPVAVADAADPLQKRAAAAGLSPDLSRVLLAQLTEADYRNARIAVDKAVAGTSDTDVFVWPRQRKPSLAMFEVHFVPGAAPHCRRYVVTITKSGWLTTAAPMEKCGAIDTARKD